MMSKLRETKLRSKEEKKLVFPQLTKKVESKLTFIRNARERNQDTYVE